MLSNVGIFVIALIFSPVFAVAAANADVNRLTIGVDGFEIDDGQMGINIFRNEDEMFAHPFRVIYAAVKNKKAEVIIEGLPLGDYAIVAYHDRNGNGKLDHHFIGFPLEPIGYSGEYEFGLFSGMPSFSKLRFHYQHAMQHLTIHIAD